MEFPININLDADVPDVENKQADLLTNFGRSRKEGNRLRASDSFHSFMRSLTPESNETFTVALCIAGNKHQPFLGLNRADAEVR